MSKTKENENQLSFSTSINTLSIVDGVWKDVSLLSIGDAKGHGMYVDKRSLQTAFEVGVGKSIKAFNNHSNSPSVTETLGIFSGIHVDYEAGKLKAKQFQILDSYKDNYKSEYDVLNELAINHPETFGVSLTFTFTPVWVLENGDEVDAYMDWRLGNSPPEGACKKPRVRFNSIISADIVSNPAANADGLFSADVETETEELSEDVENDSSDLNSENIGKDYSKIMIKDIQKQYGETPELLTEAINFAANDDVETFEAVETHIEQFKTELLIKGKDTEIEQLKGELSTKDEEIKDLKSQLETLAGGEGEFSTGEEIEPETKDVLTQYNEIEDYNEAIEFFNANEVEIKELRAKQFKN